MPSTEVAGYTYSYIDEGEGEPVIFGHGLLADKEMFRAQIDVLKPSYRCISIDLRGHGDSSGPSEPFTLEQQAEEVAQLLGELEVERAAFCGLSQGGMTFMRLALARPEMVRGLVLLDTSADAEDPENLGRYRELATAYRDLPDRSEIGGPIMDILYGKTWRSKASPPQRDHERRKILGHDGEGAYAATNAVLDRGDIREEIERITAPTLVMVGVEDVATPPEKAEEIRDAISGTKLVRIPAAGHHSAIENPEAVSEALETFLAELSWEG